MNNIRPNTFKVDYFLKKKVPIKKTKMLFKILEFGGNSSNEKYLIEQSYPDKSYPIVYWITKKSLEQKIKSGWRRI